MERITSFKNSLRVGFFLAIRSLKRASRWTTILIIFVMLLTFLNIVVVSGVLVGLIEGAVSAQRDRSTSDIIIRSLDEKQYIENSSYILSVLDSIPEINNYSARYMEGGEIEANYQTKFRESDIAETTGAQFSGIDPIRENEITGIGNYVIEGEFIEPEDFDQVVIGANLLKKYLPIESPDFKSLYAEVGDKIRITVGGATREVRIKGIIKSKVDEIDFRVFFPEKQLRALIGRSDFNVDEIAIQLKDGEDPVKIKEVILKNDIARYGKVQTFEEAQPKFLEDIKNTFALLGNMISSIGLVVASITVFIVIFINAITRRKFIGILKGIGVDHKAIEISYVIQSFFYALIGSILGLTIVYFLLVPLFQAHPINFPFSDGILVAPFGGTMFRLTLLVIITMIAGYIPARMIVRKNTLNSILGRN